MSVVLGFAPWILFWTLTGNDSFREAAVAALVASIVLIVWERTSRQSRSVKLLDVGTLAWFAILTVVSFVADTKWLADWSYALSNVALTAIAVSSVVVGKPFTEQYARDEVPEEYWGTSEFKRINLVITWVWIAAFIVMAVSSLAATALPDEKTYDTWLNWILPIGALVAAIKFTQWYPDQAKGASEGAPATTSAD